MLHAGQPEFFSSCRQHPWLATVTLCPWGRDPCNSVRPLSYSCRPHRLEQRVLRTSTSTGTQLFSRNWPRHCDCYSARTFCVQVAAGASAACPAGRIVVADGSTPQWLLDVQAGRAQAADQAW
eukprot:638950-Amphidinium_carterae.1